MQLKLKTIKFHIFLNPLKKKSFTPIKSYSPPLHKIQKYTYNAAVNQLVGIYQKETKARNIRAYLNTDSFLNQIYPLLVILSI